MKHIQYLLFKFTSLAVISIAFPFYASAESVVWSDNFGGGLGDWAPDRGVWEVGVPTAGPGSAYSGSQCAGTVLAGDYPYKADSRLISPSFTVPEASLQPRLRFWHWFENTDVSGRVEVRPAGGSWTDIGTDRYTESGGGVWTRTSIDLSAYSGQEIQIAFRFISDWPYEVASGWYIDDVALVTGIQPVPNPEGFEMGLADWAADRGVWEVGIPTAGPGAAYSGSQCAGTVLAGNYPYKADSRLISPSFIVPEASLKPRLRFWHWFENTDVSGRVQVRPAGGSWTDIGTDRYTESGGGVWTRASIDLSAYSGQEIQIGFRFISDWPYEVAAGWYIDEVQLATDALLEIPSVQDHLVGTPLNLTVQSTVPDLSFSLSPDAPEGASIDPISGEFSWTPTELQGPGMYTITILAGRDGSNLSPFASTSFTVEVVGINSPPVLAEIGSRDIPEGIVLAFVASATDPDLPAPTLTYSLVNAPEGSVIDPLTGSFSWTPTEAQGPGSFSFSVQVSDGELTATQPVVVTVSEVNTHPVLTAVSPITVNEGDPVSFSASAQDEDLPAASLAYSLVNAPIGAGIDPLTGIFNWTPAGEQAAGSYNFIVQVSDGELTAQTTVSVTIKSLIEAPDVSTAPASQITASSALLRGTIKSNGGLTQAYFEFGPTIAYGSTASASIAPGTGDLTQTVSVPIMELKAGKIYHYRLVVTYGDSAIYGADATFTTRGLPLIAVQEPYRTNLKNGKSSRSFGSVPLKSKTSKTFTIKNNGAASLKITTISSSGAHAGDFMVRGASKRSLAPGERTTFLVIFKPNAKGPRKAVLQILSNDKKNGSFKIFLKGNGKL